METIAESKIPALTQSHSAELLTVVVSQRTMESSDIVRIDLYPGSEDRVLPSFKPGAHIDIQLPNGILRSYSLIGPGADPSRYSIAVKKDGRSRGGSSFVHEKIQIGDQLLISPPKNYFELDQDASGQLFIAGGIGITPFISMISATNMANKPWRLLFATRQEQDIPFLSSLRAQAGTAHDRLQLFISEGKNARRLDIAESINQLPPAWSVYCCGPAGMLQAFEHEARHLPPERVRIERFAAQTTSAQDDGFIVELARTGKQIYVQSGQSILDALEEAGISVLWGCREGLCGSCEVKVISGSPCHLDHVLTIEERQKNATLMVCCSRSYGERLVLDL